MAGAVNSLNELTSVQCSGSLQGAGGIGGLLARTDMGRLTVNDPLASAYYHADGNGNITALITDLMDTNQVLVAKYLYDPYGNLVSMSGPLAGANKYRFSSKEWNDNASLYYYGFRFYDPNLQRWVNRDPIHEWGGWNLYGFVANNPINNVDPLGLWNLWAPWTWGVPNGIGTSLGNSLNPFDASAGWSGFSLQTSSEADAAFLDGINPFGNPLANAGLYDPCDKGLQWSKRIGGWTRDAEIALASGPRGPIFGKAGPSWRGAGKLPGLLNRGDALRLGWSWNNSAGRLAFSLRVGGRHFDLFPGPASTTWW